MGFFKKLFGRKTRLKRVFEENDLEQAALKKKELALTRMRLELKEKRLQMVKDALEAEELARLEDEFIDEEEDDTEEGDDFDPEKLIGNTIQKWLINGKAKKSEAAAKKDYKSFVPAKYLQMFRGMCEEEQREAIKRYYPEASEEEIPDIIENLMA